MDTLTSLLMKRQMNNDGEDYQSSPPPSSTQPNKVPPAWQRWATAEKMKQAYANGWNPNPLLVRILDHA